MTTPTPPADGSPNLSGEQPSHRSQYMTATAPADRAHATTVSAKKPAGLAIAALIVSIIAFLTGLIPVLGAIIGAAGIALGIMALLKRQSKGMAITALVLSGIAVISSIVTASISAAVIEASTAPAPVSAPEASQSDDAAGSSTEPTTAAEPSETTAPEPEEPAAPADFVSALTQAAMYSETLNMSKAGLYDQLVSEFGGQFSPEAAQYGVDNVAADWNANAVAKAKTYQETMAMSPEAIRDQLTSEFGEKFTPEEADYAIQHLND